MPWPASGSRLPPAGNGSISSAIALVSFWFLVSGFWLATFATSNQKRETRNQKPRNYRGDRFTLLALVRCRARAADRAFFTRTRCARKSSCSARAMCPHVRVAQDVFGNAHRAVSARLRGTAPLTPSPRTWTIRDLSARNSSAACRRSISRRKRRRAISARSPCGTCRRVKCGTAASIRARVTISSVARRSSRSFTNSKRRSAEASVIGLFTRAEEVGFIGAIQLAKSGRVAARRDRDCLARNQLRAQRPGARIRMGAGRDHSRVGDKTSIFDDSATRALTTLAVENKLPHQRCLMRQAAPAQADTPINSTATAPPRSAWRWRRFGTITTAAPTRPSPRNLFPWKTCGA